MSKDIPREEIRSCTHLRLYSHYTHRFDRADTETRPTTRFTSIVSRTMPVKILHVRRATDPFPDLGKKEECDSRKFELETTSLEKAVYGSLTSHHSGLIIAAIACNIAVFIALFLILQHATHYMKPYEQKQFVMSSQL